MSLLEGVLATILGSGFIWLCVQVLWPLFRDVALYGGIRVDGVWEIYETQNSKKIKSGEISFKQYGCRITATGHRTKTRSGAKNDRKFKYKGRIHKNQITLTFEDAQGDGFDCGTYVLCVHNSLTEMEGITTFHGKPEGRIVSEQRFLKKTAKPNS